VQETKPNESEVYRVPTKVYYCWCTKHWYDHVIDSGCIAYDSASVSETVKASLDNVVDLSVFTY